MKKSDYFAGVVASFVVGLWTYTTLTLKTKIVLLLVVVLLTLLMLVS